MRHNTLKGGGAKVTGKNEVSVKTTRRSQRRI